MIHLPSIPPCSTKVDVLETGDAPILFSLSQMKNLGTTIGLNPKRDKVTCPAFGMCSSPAEHSLHNGAYCVGLDEPCVSANDQVA